jgi:ubiquinone/menaquinone biosynthesis C-methylase UbiE
MDHADHVALIRDGIPKSSGVWADFGSGSGAFTLALAEILEPGSHIYSVDKNAVSLQNQARAMRERYPGIEVQYLNTDYTHPLDLPPLDGAIMANSLHFQHDKDSVLAMIRGYLQPWGRLILVEYNLNQGNTWVPYPLSYKTWEMMARRNGFASTRLLARRPSRFMGEIYAALSCLSLELRDSHERGRQKSPGG